MKALLEILVSALPLLAEREAIRQSLLCRKPRARKKDVLRICGADLRLVPAVPYRDPNNYVRYSERLANKLSQSIPEGVIWANQFDNLANRDGHYTTQALNVGHKQMAVLTDLSVLLAQVEHWRE